MARKERAGEGTHVTRRKERVRNREREGAGETQDCMITFLITFFHRPTVECASMCRLSKLVAVLDFKRTANPWGLESMCIAPRVSRQTNGGRAFPVRRHRCAVGALLADGLERASRRGP